MINKQLGVSYLVFELENLYLEPNAVYLRITPLVCLGEGGRYMCAKDSAALACCADHRNL